MIGYTANTGPVPQYIQTAGYSLGIVSTPGKPVMTFKPPRPLIRSIQDAVASHYGLRLIDMVSSRRGRAEAWPRQVAMCLCRELTTSSLPNIGKHFGGRDHTTVIHAIKAVAKRMVEMPGYRADVEVLRKALR